MRKIMREIKKMNPSQGFILTGIFFAFRVRAPMLSDTPGYHLTFCKHLFFIAFRIKRLREIQLLYWFEILVHIFFMRYSLDAYAPIIQEDKPCSIPILAQYICKNTKNIQKK